MPAGINGGQLNAAAGTNQSLRLTLQAIVDKLQQHDAALGTGPLQKVDAAPQKVSAPPPPSTLSVVGANGAFTVTITLPQQSTGAPQNANKGTLYQEVSSCASADFSSGVTTYPLSTGTSFLFANPGATLYWRLRSSYDQKVFNSYSKLPGSVSAGLQTSAASSPAVVLNQSNFARIDSVGAGATATIRVYGPGGIGTSWPSVTGTTSKVIPSGTILGITYGTTKFVAWDGSKYQVVPTLSQAFPDGWLPVGSVSVIATSAGLTLPTIHPVISSGAIIAYNVVSGGTGITGPLSFAIFDSGGGTGATVGAATVSGGVLQSLAAGNPGSAYTGATTVTPSGGVSGGVAGGGGSAGSNQGRLFGLTQNGV